MLAQAVGFALLAALSPTALVVATVLLASADPRRTVVFFLVGGVLMTVVVGALIFVALRAGGLQHADQRDPRYCLRLALGGLAITASLVLAARKPRPRDPNRKPNLVSRLVASPAPRTAFAAGLVVFSPSLTFIAAVQVIATAEEGVALVAVAAALVTTIVVALAWLPLVLYLVTPDGTTRTLKAIDGWLRVHGRAVLVAGLAVAGVALVANGALGLAG
ncbi:MAG TPA: GAP family protein [Streptosporangiaceae bacterium]|nr:GAP family protein [Streptosporangiaceae bacterium]